VATALPLPKHADLPDLVVFHRDHPSDPVLTMQVPVNEARSSFETYLIRLDQEAHKGWFERLPGATELRDRLTYEMHVAYSPQTGHLQEMEDVDAVSYPQQAVAYARAMARPDLVGQGLEQRQAVERVAPPTISRLRDLLGGPEQRFARFYGRGGFAR